jgi:cellulose synthase/poly-beta-1,6-N-acetylglucosamine synthase-like glycosyltransferase
MAKNDLTLSSMVGENLEIYYSQMAKIDLKLPTMVGENFENHLSQLAKNDLKLSTMFGENFEIYFFQMAKNYHILSMVRENFKFTSLKWLKIILDYPPWLENILKFTCLKW